jgi:hypothetical protein
MKSFFIGVAVFLLVVVLVSVLAFACPFILVYAIYSRTLETVEHFRPRKGKARRRLYEDLSSLSPALSKTHGS